MGKNVEKIYEKFAATHGRISYTINRNHVEEKFEKKLAKHTG